MSPNPPGAPTRPIFRPPPPPQQPPTNQSVPVVVRCVLIGLTLFGLLLVVYQVKQPATMASEGQGGGAGGSGPSVGSGSTGGGGEGSGFGGPGGGGSGGTGSGNAGGTGQASSGTNTSQVGSSGGDSSGGQHNPQSDPGTGPGSGQAPPIEPLFNPGSSSELNNVIHGIAKDSTTLSGWSLYQRINFHYHSIDEVLLTLMKYSKDTKTTQAYAAFKTAFSEIEKKPLDRYCARSIASQTKIMAGVSLALAKQGVNDTAQVAELENMSKAIGDAPNSLDDHDALMARVTADCLSRITARNIRPQDAVQKISVLRNQIASSAENNGPVKASEIAYNTMAQIMTIGLESVT